MIIGAWRAFKTGRKIFKLIKRALKDGDELRLAISDLVKLLRIAKSAGYPDSSKQDVGRAATKVWIEGEDVWQHIDDLL